MTVLVEFTPEPGCRVLGSLEEKGTVDSYGRDGTVDRRARPVCVDTPITV